jgi:UDP-glucuronate decarboxylase
MNLGNAEEFRIIDLAEKILKLTNSNSKILMRNLPQDDPKQRKPDLTYAESILSWKTSVALEEGLKKTIEYFRKVGY